MKLSINGVAKKGETKVIKDIIDKLLDERFTTWKLLWEDSKGGTV